MKTYTDVDFECIKCNNNKVLETYFETEISKKIGKIHNLGRKVVSCTECGAEYDVEVKVIVKLSKREFSQFNDLKVGQFVLDLNGILAKIDSISEDGIFRLEFRSEDGEYIYKYANYDSLTLYKGETIKLIK